jgi:HNH/Endo VII superfamily nuclease toxins
MTAPAAAVDLSLPVDDVLTAAATPDPRVEAARLTATGHPAQIAAVGRELGESGAAMDGVYEQSRRAQQVLAASFVNDGSPVYDEAAHWSGLPTGFRDAGTWLHDAGRRLGVVAEEPGTAIADVTGRLNRLTADLHTWRAAWGAEVNAARGPSGLIPVDAMPRLQARRADVAAGMQEAATACGQGVAARVGRYDEILGDCMRVLGDSGSTTGLGVSIGTGGPADTSSLRPGDRLVLGGRLESSSPTPPVPPTPGFTLAPTFPTPGLTPAPQGPFILANPIPQPLPGLPGFTPAPRDPGPLITVPGPGLGPRRDAAASGSPAPGTPPLNLAPEGAGREGAFGQAKRDSGIPVGMPPTRVLPNIDKREQIQPGRVYEYDLPAPGGGTRTVRIRDDAGGHEFPDDPSQNRGPHFNTDDGGHYDY